MTQIEVLHEVLLHDPLYKRRSHNGPIFRTLLPDLPPINYYCAGTCQSGQTFKVFSVDNGQERSYHENLRGHAAVMYPSRFPDPVTVGNHTYHLTLYCLKCNNYKIHFILSFAEKIKKDGEVTSTIVQKIGQLPTVEEALDKEIEKWLHKEDVDVYKKGLRSEANGFGIGAFGYFRRVVEDNDARILVDIAATTDSQELVDAVEVAKDKHSAADRLEIVKDHAPGSFIVDGQNVLAILYAALSEGLHNKSDDECLEAATSIRVCLNFLIKKVSVAQQERDELSSAIKGLTQPSAPKT